MPCRCTGSGHRPTETADRAAAVQLVVSAAQVLTGPAGARIADGAVLVDGTGIVAVGSASEVRTRAEPGTSEAAYPGGTILPGLINCHVHLAFAPGPDLVATVRAADDSQLLLAMAGRAQQLLNCGVTTARDLGDRGGLALRVRDAIAHGALAGPRILAATAPLTPPGGHCWFLGGEVEGESQIRARVRSSAEAGADVIKVMVSGGSLTPGGAAMWESQFGVAEVGAVVDEARRLGLRVAAHAHGTDSIRTAVAAGVDTIEHCTWLTGPGQFEPCEETAAQLAAAGVAVCPANSGDWQRLAGAIGEDRARQLVGRIRWMADRGVRLVAGTDAGLTPFDDFPASLLRYQEWGFSAAEIIEIATAGAASALGLAETGRVAAGLSADLLVVHGDPLADLRALQRPELVLARGRAHIPDRRINCLDEL